MCKDYSTTFSRPRNEDYSSERGKSASKHERPNSSVLEEVENRPQINGEVVNMRTERKIYCPLPVICIKAVRVNGHL